MPFGVYTGVPEYRSTTTVQLKVTEIYEHRNVVIGPDLKSELGVMGRNW